MGKFTVVFYDKREDGIVTIEDVRQMRFVQIQHCKRRCDCILLEFFGMPMRCFPLRYYELRTVLAD